MREPLHFNGFSKSHYFGLSSLFLKPKLSDQNPVQNLHARWAVSVACWQLCEAGSADPGVWKGQCSTRRSGTAWSQLTCNEQPEAGPRQGRQGSVGPCRAQAGLPQAAACKVSKMCVLESSLGREQQGIFVLESSDLMWPTYQTKIELWVNNNVYKVKKQIKKKIAKCLHELRDEFSLE